MSDVELQISERALKALEHLQSWYGKHSQSETIAFLAKKQINQNEDSNTIGEENVNNFHKPIDSTELIENVSLSELSHTKPISAIIEDTTVESNTWKHLLIGIFQILNKKGKNPNEIIQALTITAVTDGSLDCDYPHDPVTNISFYPQPAYKVWEEICNLSSAFGLSVEVQFRWGINPKAAYPGQFGIIRHVMNSTTNIRNFKSLGADISEENQLENTAPEYINSECLNFYSIDDFLKSTEIINVCINYEKLYLRNWIDVFKTILIFLKSNRSFTSKELISEVEIIIVDGYFDDEHYTFLSDLGFSVKYSTATQLGRELTRLCNRYDIPIEIQFRWKNNPNALFPNQQSVLLAGSLTKPTGELRSI